VVLKLGAECVYGMKQGVFRGSEHGYWRKAYESADLGKLKIRVKPMAGQA
jgi:hypothetical protein